MSPDTLRKALLEYFGLEVTDLLRLPGEVALNYRVTTGDDRRYLVKIGPAGIRQRFEAQLLRHLSKKTLSFSVPSIVHSVDLPDDRYLRVQSWLPGRPLSQYRPIAAGGRRRWGQVAAELNTALRDFPTDHGFSAYPWNPSQTLDMRSKRPYFSEEQRALADYFWDRFARETLPVLPDLAKSTNHNDLHPDNLLVDDNGLIVSVIDFGDAMVTESVNELAITCAYAAMDVPDPVAAIVDVARAYRNVQPLTGLRHLGNLIAARLLITVSLAAERAVTEPGKDYHQVSARPAWALLRRMRSTPPGLLHAQLEPGAYEQLNGRIGAYAKANARPPVELTDKQVLALDLSVGSLQLGHYGNYADLPLFTRHVRRLLEDYGAEYATGGYGETRPVYTTDAFAEVGNEGPRWRTVHLGLDVWGPAGTPVFAPLPGRVHSLGVDRAARGYGPTLILEHALPDGTPFYTLYGHLSEDSLEKYSASEERGNGPIPKLRVRKGEEIARFGGPGENGGWPPHLHFQVMTDMLGNEADFPGVAFPERAEGMLALCPPPYPFFGLPEPAEAMNADPIRERGRLLGGGLSVSYERPLRILRGRGAYLLDHTGRRFLDTVNNVAHVGHEHPVVVEAIRKQAAVLNTNSRYLHEEIVAFARELTATLPADLSVVHFVNSGSEANDLALRMCEVWSGTRDMLTIDHGYHGHTGRTIDVSPYKFNRAGGNGQPSVTATLPLPDPLRGRNLDVATALRKILAARHGPFGGFIGESILGCGGQVPLPAGYLTTVYDAIRAQNGLCIADEVQTGLGRVGSHWWAFELQGVVPDIVTIGKPLGNGHPVAAVVCTEAVADRFNNGMEYFNTFGGNPVSCAAGRAVLRVMAAEGLRGHATRTGQELVTRLRDLQREHPLIADVRGAGLFLGIELAVKDLRPATAQARYIKERMRELGFLMSTDGPAQNVLKIKPPLCFSAQDGERLVDYLHVVLGETQALP